MQLRRLAALERKKIEDEYKAVMELIGFLEDLLAHPLKMLKIIKGRDYQAQGKIRRWSENQGI